MPAMWPFEIHSRSDVITYGTRESWAMLSRDEKYRYMLGRAWDHKLPTLSIYMLNPSTADALSDDPTIRKCVHFAKQEGCGSLLVRNLFAYRTTDPMKLRVAKDPYGPFNDVALSLATPALQAMHVAAWGSLGTKWLKELAEKPLSAMYVRYKLNYISANTLYVFGLTKNGDPRHPLYLANATRARLWTEM